MTHSLTVSAPPAIRASADVLVLIDQFIAALNQRVQANTLAAATRDTYHNGIDRFVDFALARRAVDGDVILDWMEYLRGQGCTPGSINTWLAGVRAFFAWAEGKRYIAYNPARGIAGARRLQSKAKHKRDLLTDSEVLRVLAQPDESRGGRRDRAYLMLRAYTGVRDVELVRADVGAVETRGDRTVLAIQGKGHTEPDDYAVLLPEVEAALRDWLAVRHDVLVRAKKPQAGALFISLSNRTLGERLDLSSIRWMVKRYFRAAGVTGPKKTSHSLRHSAITSVIRHGGSLLKAQSLARHADPGTTAIYAHETDRLANPPEEYVRYDEK